MPRDHFPRRKVMHGLVQKKYVPTMPAADVKKLPAASKHKEATAKQLDHLRDLGVPRERLERISRRDASLLLDLVYKIGLFKALQVTL